MNKSVLILDHDEALCSELETVLSDSGYQVISGNDGPEGKRLLEERDFDLVILGLEMTLAGEKDLLGPLFAKGLETKVLVLSGRPRARAPGSTGLAGEGRVAPNASASPRINDFLSKPLHIQALLDKVGELTSP